MKISYIVFYDKKSKAPPVQIPITIHGNYLRKVSSQRVLGAIIDEELYFTPPPPLPPHVENITKKKSKQAYSCFTCFTDMHPDLAGKCINILFV